MRYYVIVIMLCYAKGSILLHSLTRVMGGLELIPVSDRGKGGETHCTVQHMAQMCLSRRELIIYVDRGCGLCVRRFAQMQCIHTGTMVLRKSLCLLYSVARRVARLYSVATPWPHPCSYCSPLACFILP